MTDRDLLEKAAKAAGYAEPNWPPRYDWNPLTYDSDAFRLMVDLDIKPVQSTAKRWICIDGSDIEVAVCGDIHAATRRAIVLAAAAMVDTGVGEDA
jgi:hypothetical protein